LSKRYTTENLDRVVVYKDHPLIYLFRSKWIEIWLKLARG